jgi:mono/diheme cytochrome c family protein
MSTNEHGHGHGGEGASAESVAAGYEVTDWQIRPVVVLTAATFGTLILAFIVMGAMLFVTGSTLGDTSNTLLPTGEARLPPEPRLEQNPNVDSERMLATAVERLESYGWVDQPEGPAHVPIERAMELLVERGIEPFAAGADTGGEAAPAPTTAPAAGGEVVFDAALAAQGEQLFASVGCAGCHRSDGAGIGPSLNGIYNQPQTLTDGSTAVADEAFLIESILNPTAKVVEGYQPIMPPYQGQLSDDQVAQLVEYIKSLAQ